MILFYNDFDIVALSFQCNDQDQIYTCILDRSVVHNGVEVMSIEKIHSQLISSWILSVFIWAVLYRGDDLKVVTSPLFFE